MDGIEWRYDIGDMVRWPDCAARGYVVAREVYQDRPFYLVRLRGYTHPHLIHEVDLVPMHRKRLPLDQFATPLEHWQHKDVRE